MINFITHRALSCVEHFHVDLKVFDEHIQMLFCQFRQVSPDLSASRGLMNKNVIKLLPSRNM